MSASPPKGPPPGKIYPRNLTARAHHQIGGNPPATRPESGVDNAIPGLEFDTRNLEGAFLPGLRVEFHRDDGAVVTGVQPERFRFRGVVELHRGDLPLYLWAVGGRTTGARRALTRFRLAELGGLAVLRRVRALRPGIVVAVLGPYPPESLPSGASELFAEKVTEETPVSRVERTHGRIQWVFLIGERNPLLSEDGVIDPADLAPGDLTRTMCVPWQYDFKDCGCHYWASNRPDLVTSLDGGQPHAFYLRADRRTVPPPEYVVPEERGGRRKGEIPPMRTTDLLDTRWNILPVVLDDREQADDYSPDAPLAARPMTPKAVVRALRRLATVEHALAVEYLVAHYSLDAPRELAGNETEKTRHIFAAAQEIFAIAVDEMRHFRWVNEALLLLDAEPALGRARHYGPSFPHQKFARLPLTRDRLQWFIDVEAPSQSIGQTLDGMYVRLLQSIARQPARFEEHERLVQLIKLIVDEGTDHYRRFLSVRDHLKGLRTHEFLRKPQKKQGGRARAKTAELLAMSDDLYLSLMRSLASAFAQKDTGGGIVLHQSRRTMLNLHEVNHELASRNRLPRFRLPADLSAVARRPRRG